MKWWIAIAIFFILLFGLYKMSFGKNYLNKNNFPRGIRNNNPGNIRINPGNDWLGRIPLNRNTDGSFEQFISMPYGIRAMAILIKNNINRGNNTLSKLISRWAPASDGNNTTYYIRKVSDMTGIKADDIIEPSRENIKKIAKGICLIENGQDYITEPSFQIAWMMI